MKIIACCVVSGALPLVACGADVPTQRYPLNVEAIVRALHTDGLEVQANEVRMPMLLSASVERPTLELFGADRLPDGHVRMHLRCRKAGECVAFSVTLDRKDPALAIRRTNVAAVSAIDLHETAAGDSPVPAVSTYFQAGAKLTLLMNDGHMRIHLPVIALDSSAAGSEVRVCTPDRKRTFRARVVDATTVRGIVE